MGLESIVGGDIVYNIRGDQSALERDLAKAKATAETSFRDLASRSSTIMIAAGGAIVGALGKAAKGYMDYAEQTLSAAQKTGFTTDAVQELSYTAEQCSTSFEAITNATRFMYRAIAEAGDAATKTGNATNETADSFKRLGLDINQIKSLAPDAAFMKIAGALAAMKDPAEQTQIGMKLFGRQFMELKPLLAEGADGMARLRQEARSLGLVMDKDLIEKGEALGDEFSKAFAQFRMAGMQAGVAILPVLSDLAGYLGRVATWLQRVDPWVIKFGAGLGALALAAGGATKVILGLSTAVSAISGVAGAATGFVGATASLGGFLGVLGPAVLPGAIIATGVMILGALAGNIMSTVRAWKQAEAALVAYTHQAEYNLNKASEAVAKHGVVVDKAAMANMTANQQSIAISVSAMEAQAKQYQSQRDEILKTIAADAHMTEQQRASLERRYDALGAHITGLKAKMAEARGELEKLSLDTPGSPSINQLAAASFTSYMGMIQGLMAGIRQTVASTMGWAGNVMSSLVGGGAPRRYASGGRVEGHGPLAIVEAGEQGPEMVTTGAIIPRRGIYALPVGATVHNATETAAMLRGGKSGGVSVTVNTPQIVVREEADIERIGRALAGRIRMGMAVSAAGG